tara:strand:+ start:68 stop:352 length:285 start_codon:yes stop_codon:yes gene_type:complete
MEYLMKGIFKVIFAVILNFFFWGTGYMLLGTKTQKINISLLVGVLVYRLITIILTGEFNPQGPIAILYLVISFYLAVDAFRDSRKIKSEAKPED